MSGMLCLPGGVAKGFEIVYDVYELYAESRKSVAKMQLHNRASSTVELRNCTCNYVKYCRKMKRGINVDLHSKSNLGNNSASSES
jgi:hypothetical protein